MRQKHETQKRAKLTAKNGGCVVSFFSNFQKVQCGLKGARENCIPKKENSHAKKAKGGVNA